MKDLTHELMQMKKKIDEAKAQKSEAEGALKQLHKQLKDGYGCDNLDQAREKLKEMMKETDKMGQQIEKGMEKLREDYDW